MAMAGVVLLTAAWSDYSVFTMLAFALAGMPSGVIVFCGHIGLLQAGRLHLTIVFLA